MKTILKNKMAVLIIMAFILFFGFSVSESEKAEAEGAKSPATITVVTDNNREKVLKTKLQSNSGETYNPTDRQYQHCACACATGERIWACWNAGGPNEPDADMYAVLVYSDDYGKTWVDPAIIIDNIGYTDYTPYMFVDDLNRFWVTWNYGGTYAMIIENPEASMNEIKIVEKGKILPKDCSSAPVVLKDGTYLATTEGTMPYYHLYASTDKGETWELRYTFETHADIKHWNEGHVVELSDGTLMLDSRIEVGDGYEIYTSTDKGYTWSDADYYRGKPFVSCGTKSSFITLSNGNVIWATNNSTNERVNMTIWISTDNAATWSDGLLLDSSYSEYPAACELKDGRVFVIWTRERTKCAEMRCAVLSTDDIRNSEYTTSTTMMLVARGHEEYKDIVSTNLKEEYTVEAGTSFDDVVASLPKYIKITDDSGYKYAMEIESYTCSKYKGEAGTYRFDINIDDDTFQNVYDKLYVTVKAVEKSSDSTSSSTEEDTGNNGCSSMFSPFIFSLFLPVTALIYKRRRECDDK